MNVVCSLSRGALKVVSKPAPAKVDILVGIAVGIDLAGDRCPIDRDIDLDVALLVGLLGPCLDNKRDFSLGVFAAQKRMTMLDRVFGFGEGITADAAETLGAYLARGCARDLQQRRRR